MKRDRQDERLGASALGIVPIRAWCIQELALLRRQMELLQSGKVGTYERDDDGKWIDTTGHTVKQLEMKIVALASLLADRTNHSSKT